MDEINRFVVLAQSGRFSVTGLCSNFGSARNRDAHLARPPVHRSAI
jgi:hypothetical protein